MWRHSLWESFGYAFTGIVETFRVGRNFKIQLGFAIAAIILGIVFRISTAEWAIIVICFGLVLGGECVNTAIESIVDLASPDYHELAKRAKDCAAGGVLIAAIASLVVAALIFLPRIFDLFLKFVGA